MLEFKKLGGREKDFRFLNFDAFIIQLHQVHRQRRRRMNE